MSKDSRQTPRKPATKLAHLQKKMQKQGTAGLPAETRHLGKHTRTQRRATGG